MTSSITAMRQQLADQFEGVTTADGTPWARFSDMPGSASAPGVIVGIALPYLTPDATFRDDQWWVRQSLWVLASKQTNQAARAELDQMIATAIRTVIGSPDWVLERDTNGGGIDAPVRLQVGSDTFTAARIPVAAAVTITEE